MASIFKRKRKVKLSSGKTVTRQSAKWHIKYVDADGIERRVAAYKDKTASQQLAAKLEKESELARAGVVDKYKEHRQRPLSEHLQEFRDSLINKGTTEKQANQVYNRTVSVFNTCRFVFLSDVQASKVQAYLANRRRDGLGIRSSNFYLQAVKQFLNWMVADNRTAENPLAYLKGQNAKKDIRHERRALTADETDSLLTATLKGQKHHNLTGKERYMLYTLALSTGFRATELHSLTWRSFDLSGPGPSVTVLAGYAKNGKEATLPLRKDITRLFKQWFDDNGFSQNGRVFPKFNKSKGAVMLRADLEAAGIPYEDEVGRFADFHSLRHSFISNVGKSGATVKEAQTLARHSTSALTLDVYTHIGLYDERRAVEKMPQLHNTSGKDTEKNRAVALKTGTDNKPVEAAQNGKKELTPKLTPLLTPTAYPACNQSATVGNEQSNCLKNKGNDNYLNRGKLGIKKDSLALAVNDKKQQAAAGFEPANNGFANRRRKFTRP